MICTSTSIQIIQNQSIRLAGVPMNNKFRYLSLPIYSIAIYKQYIYFSGGGGGSTGIKNQILLYHRQITDQPTHRMEVGNKIIQNLTVNEHTNLMICNANEQVIVYSITEEGAVLLEKMRFAADFSMKNPTINALCFGGGDYNGVIATGGDDSLIRFFKINPESEEAIKVVQYSAHQFPIKSIDSNNQGLFVSTDNHLVVIYNLNTRQVLNNLYCDQLKPSKSLFQSAYFQSPSSELLLITHFIFKNATYVTKQLKSKQLQTIEVAADQSCQTSFSQLSGYLGIACGNGTSLMINSKEMCVAGKEAGHNFVITGCAISKKTNRLLTGTPQCSYHSQVPNEAVIQINMTYLLTLIFSVLALFLLGSAGKIFKSQGQL